MEAKPRTLLSYEDAHGRVPFEEWLKALRDAKGRAIIRVRINRLGMGNLGDCRPVGGGVSELRIDFGPGYRVYFGQDGDRVILLLGGDKSTQSANIRKAREHWSDYNA